MCVLLPCGRAQEDNKDGAPAVGHGAETCSKIVVVEQVAVDEAKEPECGDGDGGKFVRALIQPRLPV